MTRWLETDSLSNQDISSAMAIGAYTADADRLVLVQFFADQVAGNGDYVFYLTQQIAGAGSSFRLIPITTAAAATGVTAIGGQSGMIAVRSGDVLTVYIDGLAGDTTTPDTTVRWFELAALRPTTPDRTLDVSSGGEAGIDWANIGSPTTTVGLSGTTIKTATDVETDTVDIQARLPAALMAGRIDANLGAISMDEVAADNLETMLDGTGSATLTLKKLVINNPDALGVGIQVNAYNGVHIEGTNKGVTLQGGSNQALYMLSDTAAATVYIEGPATGGKGIMISSPSDGTSLPGASGIYIQTEGGHPGILFDFTDPADAIKVVNSDNGAWVLDDKLFAAATDAATAVRSELATELAHLDADVSEAGGLTAQETRDAMKLAPSAGASASGSIDDMLADMPATILTTAIAAHDDTPGTVGYLLSLLAGLDFTAVNLVTASNAGEITIKRTLTLAAVVSGLTIPADWTACYWTVKRSTDDADADALVQILESNPPDADDGLLILMGAAVDDQTAGSLTVNQALGTVTIALDDASTAALEDAVELVWDVKVHATGGKTQPGSGTATITTAVTRA